MHMLSIDTVLAHFLPQNARCEMGLTARAFAPSNIALIKYWGKRDKALNLPVTSSLSISLGKLGTTTKLTIIDDREDQLFLDKQPVDRESAFAQRLIQFLDLCRPNPAIRYRIETFSDIPVAAGLASSASGFAALVKALDQLHHWDWSDQHLSVLARIGSGSACRSLWDGFVQWEKGERDDGMDSYAKSLNIDWPELRIGLLLFTKQAKPISSREAMNITTQTSKLYHSWPSQVEADLAQMHQALDAQDFALLGETAERNALMMHQTMIDASPSIDYSTPETYAAREKIQQLRKQGVPVYFTQDAGPNLKLLFEEKSLEFVKSTFPHIQVV